MICLPAVAKHQGICLLCSPTPNSQLEELFHAVGGVVALKTEEQLNACMMTTCIMGPFYGWIRTSRNWLVDHANIDQGEASKLIIQQIQGMLSDAQENSDIPSRLDDLINEQTPGGLNEQALKNWEQLDGLTSFEQVMSAILSRINGESDGSINPSSSLK